MRICPDCRTESDTPSCPACGTDTVSAALIGRGGDPLPGTVLRGTWRIEEPIGSGGMGSVYRGRQIAIDRDVVIKVLRVDGRTADQVLKMVKRFRLEARVMSQLRHPASVQVLDFGESEADGFLFLVMELCRGQSLRETLASEGHLPTARVARIGARVCKALAEAHALGIVHRDLKPANVFVDEIHGESDVVKVGDFGIAKLADATTHLTQSGAAMGTPMYMAPEQATGGEVGPASDLYALGGLLYHLLAGTPPFTAPDTVSLLYRHLYDAPPPLLLPDCGEPEARAWRNLVGRLLAKEAAARPASADEVADALLELERVAEQGPENVTVRSPLLVAGGEALAPAPAAPVSQDDATDARPAVGPDTPTAQSTTSPVPLAPRDGASARPWIAAAAVLLLGLGGVGAWIGLDPDATVAGLEDPPAPPDTHESPLDLTNLQPGPQPAPAPPVAPEPEPPDDGMVAIPAGEYPIGCPPSGVGCFDDEKPAWTASLQGFRLARTETTVSRYTACVDAGECRPPASGAGCPALTDDQATRPVSCVSWSDAQGFCAWAGQRLPTETEWEAAARGVSGRAWAWGDAGPACAKGISGCPTSPAGVARTPQDVTPEGVHDLGGNVREWTASEVAPYDGYTGEPLLRTQRVNRGGSYAMEAAQFTRAHNRLFDDPEERRPDLGFRCAASP